MGCPGSKPVRPRGRPSRERDYQNTDIDSGYIVDSIKKDDEIITSTIQKELQNDPEVFVLNNILMSMMFFENPKRELAVLEKNTKSTMENLNQKLLKDETTQCITPDLIFENINKNIRFRPLHGPKKENSEPLLAKRIYIVNDIIDVVTVNPSEDSPHYAFIDKPSYQVTLEKSKRIGYLKLVVESHSAIPTKINDEAQKENVAKTANYSSSNIDSDIYDYSTITAVKTPQPIEVVQQAERRDTLPKTCFVQRRIKNTEEDNLDLYDTVHYISSKGFMKYFQSRKFPNSLGRALGFCEMEINIAKCIPGKLFCNLLDDEDNPFPCEIMPSVVIGWPEEAYNFSNRDERPTVTHPITGFNFKWPTNKMVQEIMSMNCVLVPKGFYKKKGENPDAELEWEIQFPQAEKYLESHMSHPQLRCYFFLLAIHKAFIEPITSQHGLLPEHIRCHMFWECEQNCLNWPEHRLGTKILRVIKNLTEKLSVGVLNDFFIQNKNVLENIPKMYITTAQRVFHDILESPAMYFIKALRCLRYTSGRFYPTLDFKDLYQILVKDGLRSTIPEVGNNPLFHNRQKKLVDKDNLWRYKKELLVRQEWEKQRLEQLNLTHEGRRDSVDSIDVTWNCEKEFDSLKIRKLLHLFIRIYIEIHRKSRQIATKEQALFYLKQAIYLINILERTAAGFEHDVREFRDEIRKEEEQWKRMTVNENPTIPPSTPARNSMQKFNFDINQQVNNSVMNLSNLKNSYISGMQPVRRVNSKVTKGRRHRTNSND